MSTSLFFSENLAVTSERLISFKWNLANIFNTKKMFFITFSTPSGLWSSRKTLFLISTIHWITSWPLKGEPDISRSLSLSLSKGHTRQALSSNHLSSLILNDYVVQDATLSPSITYTLFNQRGHLLKIINISTSLRQSDSN